jgi:hypothetical protein
MTMTESEARSLIRAAWSSRAAPISFDGDEDRFLYANSDEHGRVEVVFKKETDAKFNEIVGHLAGHHVVVERWPSKGES